VFKYLKAAFWVRKRIPLLGDVPLNLLLIPAIIVAGFIHPGLWLVGLGCEAAFLYGLASNTRFRKYVDSKSINKNKISLADERKELLEKLTDSGEKRYLKIEKRIAQTISNYDEYKTENYIKEPNIRSLESLKWTYLKLLFARAAMLGEEGDQEEVNIRTQVQEIRNELGKQQANASVRKSKEATLQILEKRLQYFSKRTETLAEMDADLTRIEAQVELARDNSRLQAKPDTISMELDFASNSMQSVWYYGEADNMIHSLDSQMSGAEQTTSMTSEV